MQRAYPPFLFTIALYLVVLKDALRVVEFEANLPFPFSAPTAAILVALIAYNVFRIFAQGATNSLAYGWIGLISVIFASVTLHLAPGSLITPRDFFGIALVQFLIPLATLTSATAYDLPAYFTRSYHVPLVAIIVLGAALTEVAYIQIDKAGAANTLLALYREGLIAYPLQTAAGKFSVRAPGLFYSGFALALFCTWVVALGIFRPQRSIWWLFLSLAALVVLAFTISRNGIIMCGAVLGFRLLFGSSDTITRWKISTAGALTAMFLVAVPAASLSSDISTSDESVYGKTSTMATRASTWSDLLRNRWVDLGLGTGSVQGVAIEGRDEILVDNFFLYLAYQDGLLVTMAGGALTFLTFWFLLQSRKRSVWSRLYIALFLASLLGFALNIVFFEPIYQMLILGPVVSLAGAARRGSKENYTNVNVVIAPVEHFWHEQRQRLGRNVNYE